MARFARTSIPPNFMARFPRSLHCSTRFPKFSGSLRSHRIHKILARFASSQHRQFLARFVRSLVAEFLARFTRITNTQQPKFLARVAEHFSGTQSNTNIPNFLARFARQPAQQGQGCAKNLAKYKVPGVENRIPGV
jgi:hypothetical protein